MAVGRAARLEPQDLIARVERHAEPITALNLDLDRARRDEVLRVVLGLGLVLALVLEIAAIEVGFVRTFFSAAVA